MYMKKLSNQYNKIVRFYIEQDISPSATEKNSLCYEFVFLAKR